jgi:hypothetical protein
MSDARLHPLPRWTAVAGEQGRALAVSLRREALLFAGALALVTVLMLISWYQMRSDPNSHFGFMMHPEVAVPLIIAGFFVPLAVWKNEEPSRRGYHWAMPIGRTPHTLLRNFFGWAWLMLALIVYLLWSLAVSLLATDPAHAVAVQIHAWQWAVPFTAVTIAYLLGSILALASDHPWRWVAAIVVVLLIGNALAQATHFEDLQWALNQLWGGRWGIATALSSHAQEVETITTQDGRRFVRVVSVADLGAWLRATLLWMGIGIAGVLVAATRHQER